MKTFVIFFCLLMPVTWAAGQPPDTLVYFPATIIVDGKVVAKCNVYQINHTFPDTNGVVIVIDSYSASAVFSSLRRQNVMQEKPAPAPKELNIWRSAILDALTADSTKRK